MARGADDVDEPSRNDDRHGDFRHDRQRYVAQGRRRARTASEAVRVVKQDGEGSDQRKEGGEPRAPDSEEPSTGFTFTERERSGVPAMTMRLLLVCVVVLGVLWFLKSR
jgi:hypothetical protein